MVLPLVLGEVGAGVGVVVLPEVLELGVDALPLVLPLVLPAAPLFASARHLSRSAPIGMASHLASAALLLEVEPLVLGVVAEPLALPPVVAAGEDGEVVELDDWAMASEDRPRRAAAVAAVRVFSIMGRVSSRKLATVWTAAADMQTACRSAIPLHARRDSAIAAAECFLRPAAHYPAERKSEMERIEKSVEVACPVRTVYNQWTQFEDFPRFMAGVKEVKQLDDTHLHWHAEVWGKDKEWDAEITEQVPDQVIAWRSVSGAPNAGAVRFEPVSHDRTRVRLMMEYEPQGAVEKTGDAVGIFSARVQNSVEDFKKFIEKRAVETGAWRGEVHGGQKQPR